MRLSLSNLPSCSKWKKCDFEVKPEAPQKKLLYWLRKRKTGARGLRSIIEKALMAAMYEVPEQQTRR